MVPTIGIMKAFALITFLVSLLGFYLFHLAAKKKGFKREVREETGERHAAKSHIPDMAGVVMLFVYAIIFPIYYSLIVRISEEDFNRSHMILYFLPIFFGGLGLLDDVIKRRSKSTRGLRALIRLPIQILLAISAALFLGGSFGPGVLFYMIWNVIFILATINAANFTDGLDGLLTGCAIIGILALCYLSYEGYQHTSIHGDKLVISGVIYAIIPLSIMIAFLFFNTYPAKIFMGDCGSMFIGSFLALFSLKTHNTFQFVIIGFVIYFALISVVIQVISYRLTGKRVFPMTPFHHSFEKWGWHENHIIWFYYFLSIVFAYMGISNSYHIYSFMMNIFSLLI